MQRVISYSALCMSVLVVLTTACFVRTEISTNDVYLDGADIIQSVNPLNKSPIVKIPINPLPKHDKICRGNYLNESCICTDGYVKVKDYGSGNLICLPLLCSYVNRAKFIGDTGYPNYDICRTAIERHNISECSLISTDNGVEICVLTYVSLSGELDECARIVSAELRNECLR
jgi:hypothetical protein